MGRKERLRMALVCVLMAAIAFSTVPVRAVYAEAVGADEAIATEPAAEPAPDVEAEPADEAAAPAEAEEGRGEEGAPETDAGKNEAPSAAGDEAASDASAAESDDEREPARERAARAPAAEESEEDAASETRNPVALSADSFIKRFSFTLESGGVSKHYDLASGQSVDATADFPDGLARSATYSGDMSISVKVLAQSKDAYPLVPGDTITCAFPSILRPNGTLTGRLRDATSDWDSRHNGVGDYSISDGKLTISYDAGYLEEKSGKVVESSIKFSGGFDTSSQTDEQFDFNLVFGTVTIGARFSKLEVVRNLSIEKSGTTSGGYASVGSDGRLTYKLEVKAGQDNTHTLKPAKVTDAFTDGRAATVDLSSVELVSATVDGEDIAPRLVGLKDGEGSLNGWDIGNLPAGQVARISYTVKVDKDGITRAVDRAKQDDPSTDAAEARTIRNTATASADDVPAVSDDFSMTVKNSAYVTKYNGRYDAEHQTQHFTVRIGASASNCYTDYYVPIYDTLGSAPGPESFARSGVESVKVRRADGTEMDVPLAAVSQPSTREWRAALPSLAPGDVYTIDAYTTVSDAYWARNGSSTVGDSDIWNYAYIGSGVSAGGFYANDLSAARDYSRFSLTKTLLWKSSPSINSDGTISWTITGNEQGKSAVPDNVAGQTITDVLGPDQVFPGGTATVAFYNQDGSTAGTDSIALEEGSTSFSYTVPDRYGTCGFRISYKSKITDWDGYVGPAKSYTNKVTGLWGTSSTGSTSARPRVPRITKKFVRQAEDWSQWRTYIYNELESGDVYTDTSRSGVSYMHFTPEELEGVALTIDGVPVDPSLYRVEPAGAEQDGKYPSFTVTFTGTVSVEKGGSTLKPSSKTPLVVSYTAKMVDPPYGTGSRDYYNDARLAAGEFEETDYDYCRRNNAKELAKEVYSSSKGIVSWKVRVNYLGYSAKPDGTCIVTDTLPAGTEFVSAYKDRGQGSMEVLGTERNEDGTTTLKVKITGMSHYEVSKEHTTDNNGNVEFHFIVKTRVTDEDYLYGSESHDFSFTNKVSLYDRYGHYKDSTATATVHHSAIKKTMTYNETTAPYAQFAIEVNKEKVDLNPSGDTVAIVDESSDTLELDPNSFSVVNAATGDPVPFEIDASGMAENRVTVKVPDETYVKIVYNAQVLGVTGKTVAVGNTAYFEGHRPGPASENSVSETVRVLKATGQAVSEPMVWLSKRDESAAPLAGATFRLCSYDAKRGWSVVRDGIATSGEKGSKGVKVESLELGRLYKLVEVSAPKGYVLDAAPRYFALYGEEETSPALPKGLDAGDVLQGPSGTVVSVYNEPYTDVELQKVDTEGRPLAGARLEVFDKDGAVARDAAGREARFESFADAPARLTLAPGTYRLHEAQAPDGYRLAEDVEFTVTGDAGRTVTQGGRPVQAVTIADESETTSVAVRKRWLDARDRDGARPESVRVQLLADDVPVDGAVVTLSEEGPDGTSGTDDDWTATFESLPVMRDGKRVAYRVQELDVPDGYTATYSWDDGAAVVTNERAFDPVSLKVEKRWEDDDNAQGIRPDRIVVRLVADGRETGVTADVRAEGPDGLLGTDDDWTAVFENLTAVEDDREVTYTVEEDVPAGYRIASEPARSDEGFVITNELAPEPEPDPEPKPKPGPKDPDGGHREPKGGRLADRTEGGLPETGDRAPMAAISIAACLGAAAVIAGLASRRRGKR